MGKSADGSSVAGVKATTFGSQSVSSNLSQAPQGSASGSAQKIQISTFIKTMYEGLLHRPAQDQEIAFWSKVLVQGGCVKVGFGIATSVEARALTADKRGVRQEVVDLYRGLLGRDPESDDVVAQHLAVTVEMNQAATVSAFVNSPEYLERCASLVP